jgi:uncharacterized protein (TIGR00369 family)
MRPPPPTFAPKSPRESAISSRRLVMPDQLNPNGTLFGGVLMAWIDSTGFMCAERHAETPRVVTASVDRLEFLRPLRSGDHAVLDARVEWVGRTSMCLEVRVEREGRRRGDRAPVATAHLTFVALDADGRPTAIPPLHLETEEDRRRFAAADVRARVYQRYRRWRERHEAAAAAAL